MPTFEGPTSNLAWQLSEFLEILIFSFEQIQWVILQKRAMVLTRPLVKSCAVI